MALIFKIKIKKLYYVFNISFFYDILTFVPSKYLLLKVPGRCGGTKDNLYVQQLNVHITRSYYRIISREKLGRVGTNRNL